MNFHEFGKDNKKAILLIHPAIVFWDFFEYVIPILSDEYRLIVPAICGYDYEDPDSEFTSVEEIAKEISSYLSKNGYSNIHLAYGCCMGGSILLRMLADGEINFDNVVCDAAITPYQFPKLITRLILIRDFLMVSMGKFGGIKLLQKAFRTSSYSEEDIKYISDVLKFISYRTILRTFDSVNNYSMPNTVINSSSNLNYWYGSNEKKARKLDLKYMKKFFKDVKFLEMEDLNHADLAPLYPELLAEKLREF